MKPLEIFINLCRRSTCFFMACLFCGSSFVHLHAQIKSQPDDRTLWLNYMDKIARPVILNLAEDKLKQNMPVVLSPRVDDKENRTKASYLEAFGRTLSGIAPWLNSEGGTKKETGCCCLDSINDARNIAVGLALSECLEI